MRFSSRQDVLVFQELVEEIDIPATQFLFEKDVLLFQELLLGIMNNFLENIFK
jgi:hypothetical protein